jgi:hypothetical protein
MPVFPFIIVIATTVFLQPRHPERMPNQTLQDIRTTRGSTRYVWAI